MPKQKKPIRRPPKDQWHLLASSKKEGLARGDDLWFKRDKSGEPIPCRRGHVDLRYTAGDARCVECKLLDNERTKDSTKDLIARKVHWTSARDYRCPEWLSSAERQQIKHLESERKRRRSIGESWHIDHIVPVDHTAFDNVITALHTPQNMQLLTHGDNARKGSHLPDPESPSVRASRRLTMDELRSFIARGMAVWSKDMLPSGRPNWDLYRRGADGVVEYQGEEPDPAEYGMLAMKAAE